MSDLGDCPYYQGIGSCDRGLAASCAFYGEPRCITEEPRGGWPSRRRKTRKNEAV